MRKINLDSFGKMLNRDEMKKVNGGLVTIRCNAVTNEDGTGQSTMTSNTATWDEAVSYAESQCTNGYTIICSAEHCA
jgi:hypothetical protein